MGKEKTKIRLRGHHLFCSNVMDVDGDPIYSARFCANFRKYQQMMADPSQAIEVVCTCGDTCRYCPSWNEQDGKCRLYDYPPNANRIDLEMLEALSLSVGDEITSGELKQRIKGRFGTTLPAMCSWACGFESVLHCSQGQRKL
ncbi:MAG: DUF1284 domain-containing protein [Chloroflexi bacterium]|nr:DUF1284 domain-containing protein [Chloroflexota bacterium]MBL7061848.1 DUF1284 domain-containing protein [Dehalococcoidia bacterium]